MSSWIEDELNSGDIPHKDSSSLFRLGIKEKWKRYFLIFCDVQKESKEEQMNLEWFER
jgi:hypothetical protein